MKITVTRGELRDALPGFARIITGKPVVATLGCVRFAAGEGGLTATATDLDQTAVRLFAGARCEGTGELIVPLQALKDLSRGDAADAVALESEGNDILVTNIAGGHPVTRTVPGTDPRDWPESGPDIPVLEAKGFLQAYRRMAPFASTDETRRTLQCVCLDVSGGGKCNATLVATDGRRLCCCNSLKLPAEDDVMIPVTRFLLWQGLPEEVMLGVAKDKAGGRICVKAGPWTYRVKAIDGAYPNWRQVLPNADGAAHRMTFTDADVEAVRKIVPALPGKEWVGIEGSAEGRLNLRGFDGDRQVRVPLTAGSSYAGAGCSVILGRTYLLDALGAGFRNFMFADQVSPLLSDDGKGAKHVLMPWRVDGAPKPQPAEDPDAAAQAQAPANGPADNDNPPAAESARAEQPKETQPMKKEQTAPDGRQEQEPSALERLQAAYETAKGKVREAQAALADVAVAIRDAVKDERKRSEEVAAVRAGLAKLQSIKV